MRYAQSNELWGQILSVLGSLEAYLSKSLIDDLKPDWEEYLLYLTKTIQYTMDQAADASVNSVQSVSAITAGLSRYSDEFYWKSEVYEGLHKHLKELAYLSVKLLEAHNL